MLWFVKQPKYMVGTLLVGIAMAVTISLGFWQLDRLGERREMNQVREDIRSQPPLALPAEAPPVPLWAWNERPVEAYGRFSTAPVFLIVNRALHAQAGAHVVSPFQTVSGELLFVDRGWIPVRLRETPPAPPEGLVRIEGYWQALPDDGYPARRPELADGLWLRLDPEGKAAMAERLDATWPARPEWGDGEFLPYGMIMTQSVVMPEGPEDRYPIPVGLSPLGEGAHLSYAIQWFSFATIFLVGWMFYLRKSIRKGRGESGR